VQLWFNGAAAVDRLGVGDDVRAAGVELAGQRFVAPGGALLAEIPVGAIATRLGIPSPISVARADLLEALARALSPGDVEYGAECVRVAQADDGVAVELADGRQHRAAVVVGADGIDSAIRQEVAPAEKVAAGYRYLRAVCDDPPGSERGVLHVALGPRGRLGTVSIGHGRRALFASFVGEPRADGDPRGRLRELAAACGSPFAELADALPQTAAVLETQIEDIDPLPRWSSGRVVLMGDAAHAATPNEGRGASEALEDASALAGRLGRADRGSQTEVVSALQAFEAARKPVTSDVQRRSRAKGKAIAVTNPLASRVRNQMLRHVIRRKMVRDIEREFGP
jgi:2-polyprenyl-6-methoxyphenol hydroxylase-like FAD-dependent oxidoreductase